MLAMVGNRGRTWGASHLKPVLNGTETVRRKAENYFYLAKLKVIHVLLTLFHPSALDIMMRMMMRMKKTKMA